MKKTILIFAISKNPWIGGIYYRKNIIFSLLTNEKIKEKYNIVILTTNEYKPVFSEFGNNIKVEVLDNKVTEIKAMLQIVRCRIKYNAKYIFPIMNYKILALIGLQSISWIADFQHNYYPEFFNTDEINARNKNFKHMSMGKNQLVVSSQNAKSDLEHFYNSSRENVYVVPFVSYIEKEIESITPEFEEQTMQKYAIQNDGYFCVSNQFWQHKNHIVIFQAIEKLIDTGRANDLHFVFTGELNDRRNSKHMESLLKYINKASVSEKISIVGLINRNEQLVIMKNSKAIIQPSLFEGWGTVLEDSKVLDKRVILSDIPIHREQKNEKCILFNPNDSAELANRIIEVNNQKYTSDTTDGIKNMYKCAYEYSKVFEKILL